MSKQTAKQILDEQTQENETASATGVVTEDVFEFPDILMLDEDTNVLYEGNIVESDDEDEDDEDVNESADDDEDDEDGDEDVNESADDDEDDEEEDSDPDEDGDDDSSEEGDTDGDEGEDEDEEELDEVKHLTAAERAKKKKYRKSAKGKKAAKKYKIKSSRAGYKKNKKRSKSAKKAAKLAIRHESVDVISLLSGGNEVLTEEKRLKKGTVVTIEDDDGNEYQATICEATAEQSAEIDAAYEALLGEAFHRMTSSAKAAARRAYKKNKRYILKRRKLLKRKPMTAERRARGKLMKKVHKQLHHSGDAGEVNVDQSVIRESVEALFAGKENLSEEFKTRTSVLFESAVNSAVERRLVETRETILEAASQVIVEETETILEDVSTKVSTFLDYLAEEWFKTNEIAIDASLRTMVAEEFIGGLKKLFESSNIEIPKEKVDLVEEYASKAELANEKIREAESRIEELNEQIINLRNQNNEAVRKQIVAQVTEGVVATDAARLEVLAESVVFTTPEEYRQKLDVLLENLSTPRRRTRSSDAADPNREVLTEESEAQAEESEKPAQGRLNPIEALAARISRRSDD